MISFLNVLNVVLATMSLSIDDYRTQLDSNSKPKHETRLTVSTPNGSNVTVYMSSGMTINVDEAHQIGDSICSSNIRLRNASTSYNCHSYAWHKQRISETQYWMNDPSMYYYDGSYLEVNLPSASIGDKVCYFDSNLTNIHSGILVQKLSGSSNGVCGNSNLIVIESKWGNWGLYRSRGDETPYTTNHGGSATSIRFYHRFYSHAHTWSYEQIGDETYHFKYCNDTGYYEEHNYIPHYGNYLFDNSGVRYIPEQICTICGYISFMV